MTKSVCILGICALASAAACTKNSPTRPADVATADTAAVTADAKVGVSLTTPQLLTPANGQRFKFAEQPLTLTVKNAVSSASGRTYTFEVASDAGFGSIVFSRDNVAEGSGQTSVKVDKLAGNKDYFWRARAVSSGVNGLNSPGRTFNVGPEVVIQAPVQISPAQNGTLNGNGALVTQNASRTGPAGQIFYKFDVSDSSSFSNIVFTSTTAEQAGSQTSVTMTAQLANNGTYYWRVQANDPTNGVTGPYSSVFSFKFVPFDMREATIQSSPADLGSWPETAKVTYVNLAPDGIQVDFDRRDGPDRWPDEPFGSGSIEYTLGMCLNITGHWYCSAVVQFWYGRDLSSGGRPDEVSFNWFYDPARWGPMTGYQPSRGETVGFFVGAGNLRGRTDPGYVRCPRICERSNVVLVPWSEDGSGVFTFGNSKKVLTLRR
jgi:hypothetical protein